MATLNDIIAGVQSDLRDTVSNTFTTSELSDLVKQGIDALADFYPKEIATTVGTVATDTYTYDVSSYMNIFRVDVHDSAGRFRAELPHAFEGRNTGWDRHGGILYIPPDWPLAAGDTLRAYGYGRYIQLSTGTSTTDLDTSGIYAVRVFALTKAYNRLLVDRALFTQWQASPGNTDVTALALNQLAYSMRQEWASEKQRLRRVRRL